MQEYKLLVMERKILVERIKTLIGLQSQFMRGRDHSYRIGDYTITRDNILIAPDDADEELLQTLFNEELIEKPIEEATPVSQEINEHDCEIPIESEQIEPEL